MLKIQSQSKRIHVSLYAFVLQIQYNTIQLSEYVSLRVSVCLWECV